MRVLETCLDLLECSCVGVWVNEDAAMPFF